MEQKKEENTKEGNGRKVNTIQSVDRALRILEVIARAGRDLGLVEVSKLVELDPSTTYRLLKTLEAHQYVKQGQKKDKYSLGFKAFEIGNAIPLLAHLRGACKGPLEALRDRTGETANLAVRDGQEALYVEQISAQQYTLRVSSEVGRRVPLHSTAVGKVVLASFSQAELNAYLKRPLTPFTAKTITSADKLREHLEETRMRNWALDDEEFEFGARCIATPVKNAVGRVIAVVSISGPSVRIGEDRITFFLPLLMQTATLISNSLNY
jgi:DNA-binding IclR family transcriptional regulator